MLKVSSRYLVVMRWILLLYLAYRRYSGVNNGQAAVKMSNVFGITCSSRHLYCCCSLEENEERKLLENGKRKNFWFFSSTG